MHSAFSNVKTQNPKIKFKKHCATTAIFRKRFSCHLELFDEFESVINISKQYISSILLAAICQEKDLKVTERDKISKTKFDVIENKTSGCQQFPKNNEVCRTYS